MTNLKTLKDLNGAGYGIRPGLYSDSFLVDSHKLRREAINWIKNLNREICRADWINFFGITEEDLK